MPLYLLICRQVGRKHEPARIGILSHARRAFSLLDPHANGFQPLRSAFENDIFEGEVVNVDALKDLIGKLPTKMVNSFKKD